MCSIASLALGVYSFTLTRTPPVPGSAHNQRLGGLLGLDALVLLKQRNFLVFFTASILICIPLAFYYQNANQFLTEIHIANATGKRTLGQMSEVLFIERIIQTIFPAPNRQKTSPRRPRWLKMDPSRGPVLSASTSYHGRRKAEIA